MKLNKMANRFSQSMDILALQLINNLNLTLQDATKLEEEAHECNFM